MMMRDGPRHGGVLEPSPNHLIVDFMVEQDFAVFDGAA